MSNEAFARIRIDQLLKDAQWRLTDGLSVRFEYPFDDGTRADYALFDRQGRALAVLEAKSTSVSLTEKEWVMPLREWAMAKAQFAVMFGERFVRAMQA